MGNVKTAISIQEPLFKKAEALARELNISRSRLFVLAVEEYIRRHQNQELLERINSAYEDEPDPAEIRRLRSMRRSHRRIVDGEW
jgi:metal-responsive CopG/Arc/MetJ family transcriptional regulator